MAGRARSFEDLTVGETAERATLITAEMVRQFAAFSGDVHAGDMLTARVTVTELDPATGNIVLQTDCFVGGRCVLEGTALMRLPRHP